MTNVRINCDRRGWYYTEASDAGVTDSVVLAAGIASYPEAVRIARVAGHTLDNAGWNHKLLTWNWHSHSIDRYPGWELDKDDVPAFVKLTHVRGDGDTESAVLANAWDDVAEADFYQRDWTDSGIPFVDKGDTYWSGWWFETAAERDRFVSWHSRQSR